MRRLTGWIWPAGIVLVAIAAEAIPPLKGLEQAINDHQQTLLVVTVVLAVLGFTLMMGAVLSLLVTSGEELSHEEVEGVLRRQRDTAAWPYVRRASAYRVLGSTAGRGADVETSFAGIKEAWRSGDWRRDASWRRVFVAIAGGTMIFFGLIGLAVILGPLAVKILFAAAMIYAMVQTASGFRRA